MKFFPNQLPPQQIIRHYAPPSPPFPIPNISKPSQFSINYTFTLTLTFIAFPYPLRYPHQFSDNPFFPIYLNTWRIFRSMIKDPLFNTLYRPVAKLVLESIRINKGTYTCVQFPHSYLFPNLWYSTYRQPSSRLKAANKILPFLRTTEPHCNKSSQH